MEDLAQVETRREQAWQEWKSACDTYHALRVTGSKKQIQEAADVMRVKAHTYQTHDRAYLNLKYYRKQY
jgi:hypothetical protein